MRRVLMVLAAAVVATLISAGSCEYRDPCAAVPPPSKAEVDAANQGAEVERELDNGVECELVNGRWIAERES